jgi:hypothetical protein
VYRDNPFNRLPIQTWQDYLRQAQEQFYGQVPIVSTPQLPPVPEPVQQAQPQPPERRWPGQYPTKLSELPTSVADLPDWMPEDIDRLNTDIRRALFDNLDSIGAVTAIRHDRKERNDKERSRQQLLGYQPDFIRASVETQEPEPGYAPSEEDWGYTDKQHQGSGGRLDESTCAELQAGAKRWHIKRLEKKAEIDELNGELALLNEALAEVEAKLASLQLL